MSVISLKKASQILHLGYSNFCTRVEPYLQSMADNDNITSFSFRVFDEDFSLDEGSEPFIHLNWGMHSNGVPMHGYNSLEDLYKEVDEIFKQEFGEFDNFFPDIWIYEDEITIEIYWCMDENGSEL